MVYKVKLVLVPTLIFLMGLVLWLPIDVRLDEVGDVNARVAITASCLGVGPHREIGHDALYAPGRLTDAQQHDLDEERITQADVYQSCGIARQRREVEVILLAILTASLVVGWHPRRKASFWWDADDAPLRTPAPPAVDPSA